MSENPAGDEIRDEANDETAPIQPPIAPNPLRLFMPLVVPVLFAVFCVCGVIYGVIPMWNMMSTANSNLKYLSKTGVDAYSHTYPAPPVTPPVYVPGNNPNGPFTPFRR
jgi:hypothetical protein